jgi:DNA-binding CsgD family transcriptional regulator
MCSAVFYLLANDIGSIAKWLLEGELTVSAANRAGYGIEFLIYTQVLLSKQEYMKIESIVPRMLDTYSMFTNQYGIIRTNIVSAIADYHLYGIEKAVSPINSAYDITEADRLIMPYLEYGEYLLPVFNEFLKSYDSLKADFSKKWLVDIIKQMKEYKNSILKFRTGFNTAHPEITSLAKVRLTKREAEILNLIAGGFSGEEISKKLYVTPINIRVITSKIYNKLGVNSRVEAVMTAIDNGLIK